MQGGGKALAAQMEADFTALKGFLRGQGDPKDGMVNLLYRKGMPEELARLSSSGGGGDGSSGGGGGGGGGSDGSSGGDSDAAVKEVAAAEARVAQLEARAVVVDEAVRTGERSVAELTTTLELERRRGAEEAGNCWGKMGGRGASSGKQQQEEERGALMRSVAAKREEVAVLQSAAAARATQAAGSAVEIKNLKAANEALKVRRATCEQQTI